MFMFYTLAHISKAKHIMIIIIDTYSLSMTRQVTASAAMTLAVLMSSLDKERIQHNKTQQ